MSSVMLSGLTTITTISLFDGWENISDIFDDLKKVACWINSQLPNNKAVRVLIYGAGSIIFLRSLPFLLRRTSLFLRFEQEVYHWHRANSDRDIMKFKEELLSDLKNDTHELPLGKEEKLVILELNAGGGGNLSYYPEGSILIATDFMEEYGEILEQNFEGTDPGALVSVGFDRFLHTRPEELASVPDESVSAVVCFHSLCSARRPDRALNEVKRVLMPGGKLFFIEHTWEQKRFSFLWFAQLNWAVTYWMWYCQNVNTQYYIDRAGFSEVWYKQVYANMNHHRGPLIGLSPHIYGFARK